MKTRSTWEAIRQNIISVAVLAASTACTVALVVHLDSAPRVHIHGTNVHSSSLPTFGREVQKVVSPTGNYVALFYSSDGAGVVPVGATVMLQSLRPSVMVSSPVAIASSALESLPFQGISQISWTGQDTLQIQSYDDLTVSNSNWHGIHIRVKSLNAAQEMP